MSGLRCHVERSYMAMAKLHGHSGPSRQLQTQILDMPSFALANPESARPQDIPRPVYRCGVFSVSNRRECLEPVAQISQQDQHGSQVNHAEEVCSVALPSAGDASKVLQPGEQPFNFPAAPIAAQRSSILRFLGADRTWARPAWIHSAKRL